MTDDHELRSRAVAHTDHSDKMHPQAFPMSEPVEVIPVAVPQDMAEDYKGRLDAQEVEFTIEPKLDDEEEDIEEDRSQYLYGLRLWLAILGMMMGELVTGIGGNMISPAFSIIANSFNAAQSLGWVSAAFYMTQFPCMLLFGQLLSSFDGKWVFMISIGFFILGSVICGSANNINAVIAGRAVSGIGAAGILIIPQAMIALFVPLKNRSMIVAIVIWVNMLSAGVGPVLAGYFANSVTWRLCFLFTMPVATISLVTIYFTIPTNKSPPIVGKGQILLDARYRKFRSGEPNRQGYFYRMIGVDWVGFFLAMLSIICLEIGLEWGGNTYPWASAQVITIFVIGFAGTFLVLCLWSLWLKELALLQLRLFRNRTQCGACFLAFVMLYCCLLGGVYLPYYFEIIMGNTSTQAGYKILPYLMFNVLYSLIAGYFTSRTGYCWIFLVVSPVFLVIAGALYYKLNEFAASGTYYGYQLIFSAGIGLMQQQLWVIIQADSKRADIHRRIALLAFTELFGGAISSTVSSAILSNSLTTNLAKYAPNAPATILNNNSIIATLTEPLKAQVIHAYTLSLQNTFVQLCGFGGAGMIVAVVFIRNINTKKARNQ